MPVRRTNVGPLPGVSLHETASSEPEVASSGDGATFTNGIKMHEVKCGGEPLLSRRRRLEGGEAIRAEAACVRFAQHDRPSTGQTVTPPGEPLLMLNAGTKQGPFAREYVR